MNIYQQMLKSSFVSKEPSKFPSAWFGHIPFGAWLVETVKPDCLVELGTHYGHSYFSFCESVDRNRLPTRCYAVDTWEGDEHAGLYTEHVFDVVRQHHDENYTGFSKLLRMTFDEAVDNFADGDIDFLHIDGLHSYEAVKHDFETWLPKLSDRAVVLFHDTNVRERDFGVWKLWSELKDHYPHIIFEHSFGLGVLFVGKEQPEAVLELVKEWSQPEGHAFIRKYFAKLGEVIEQQWVITQLHEAVANANQEIAKRDDLVNELNTNIRERDRVIQEQVNAVRERDRVIQEHVSAVQERDSVIEATQKALAERDSEFELLSTDIDDRNTSLLERTQHLVDKERQLAEVLSSKSWKLTKPLRDGNVFIKQCLRAARLVKPAIQRGGGVKSTARKAVAIYRREGFAGVKRGFRLVEATSAVTMPHVTDPVYLGAMSHPSPEYLAPRVLIVAEFSIPQCKKYRVTQKQKMFEHLGVECTAIDWNEAEKAIKALQTHSMVIFYRVPGFPNAISIIEEAKRLNIPTYWEVDDLIFNRDVLLNSKTLAGLGQDDFQGLLTGAELYLKAMLSCDYGIASTTGLAEAMRESGMKSVQVIENALDEQTLVVAEKVNEKRKTAVKDDTLRIVYGSGTNTHNVDFQEAVPALLDILATHDNVHFRLIGLLDLPTEFDQFESRIERIPVCSYEEYLESLAECDISIAPLEHYVFNDSKSNIKFLEAAAVRVPSVCSPRAAFTSAITHGVDGFLCETDDEWKDAFSQLVNSAELREEMAANAHAFVLQAYSPENIATQQLKPLLHDFSQLVINEAEPKKLRVLGVNCYYKPRAFGGATVVAAEMNTRLNQRDDFDMHMFTAVPTNVAEAYQVRRYEADGINVYGMGLPDGLDDRAQFDNPNVVQALSDVLDVVKPDIVHLHSIQGIGLPIVDLCKEKGIKYVITLHDAWWLCGRQFMIDRHGKFCGQYVIDRGVCAVCVNNASLNNERLDKMDDALRGASALLAPSRFFADFFIANGYSDKKVLVNKNGVRRPSPMPKLQHDGPVRFGYVGGNTEIKGVHLVRKVFTELNGEDAELVIVDNAMNLGFSTYDSGTFKNIEKVEIVPAYTQETIDSFFASIDVLLFPTQWKESFGLTVREALARNVWVIATDAGGVVEDIIPGENGIVIPFTDEGVELKKAVLESIRVFKNYQPGDEIILEKGQLTYFEDQAAELADMLVNVDSGLYSSEGSIIQTSEYRHANPS
ncbi:glycosyltransferase involved in cell wall biosynthesis [Vreelandella songnenensis]|uniref:Glycosyltransferase involved in cell wall biosynthesis n=1 Tax=Vreelandella songnenensis TaxID=1176243 RepID=A0A2T0V842_9GAMM|nr:glycosyltransferase [Halomonas songnenensis]PRY66350.1 glycosyltransferase involved in cell wall biosynthesis [Halomonas songnenensis]